MVTVTCSICGKIFESQKTTKKYCSDSCRNAARRITYSKTSKISKGKREYIGNDKQCPICGILFKPKNTNAYQRQCCYNCMPEGIQLTRGMFLAKIKEARGGKCVRCGYDKCITALEFHHIDPSKKDFTISNGNFKLQDAIKESKKCILLCSNCHKEFHSGIWPLEELEYLQKEEVNLDSD